MANSSVDKSMQIDLRIYYWDYDLIWDVGLSSLIVVAINDSEGESYNAIYIICS